MILCLGTTPAAQRVMVFRRLSIDAVNRAVTTLDGIAGKSINVAKVLKQLGAEPFATGFLGGDRGEHLLAVLRDRQIANEFVTVAPRTRQCTTLLDESAGTETELVEESQPVEPGDYERLRTVLARHIPRSRAVVMSGTITPGGPTSLYAECTRLAHAAGALTIVDAQGSPLVQALAARPGLVKPNRAELAATTGRPLGSETEVWAAMRELAERGATRVVVTAGRLPTLAFDGQSCWRITTPTIAALNPIGSGDAFTAGLLVRLIRGDDLGEACRWGAAAGAANALTLMAGEVNPEEVQRLAGHTLVEPVREA